MSINILLEVDRQILGMINGSDSLFLDGVMTTLTSGFTWIPLYLSLFYLIIKNNETMHQIVLIIVCAALCVLLADGLADVILKPLVARWRPTWDPTCKYEMDVVDNIRGESFYGFVSAHAANTFSIAVFFCLLVRNRLLSIFLITWSLLNCWTRMYLGLHYPSDILAGLLVGALIGILMYFVYRYIYNKISPNLNYISSQYTSTGYSLEDINVVETILVATFCYAILRSVIIFI